MTRDEYVHELAVKCSEEDILFPIEKEIFKYNKECEMETKNEYKITDLLKDYAILHERIKVLYKLLEIHRYMFWYCFYSSFIEKKNYWANYSDIIKTTINDRSIGLVICKEDMENISVRNNHIREIKNEIKRYHRFQSNIQNVLNTVKEATCIVNIRKQYNTEEVPSQFKNDMNYTYCVSY